MAFSPQFYHTWMKIMLLRGKFKFLLELPRNISPCVRSIVKSSERNGLKISQNYPEIARK